MTDDPYVPQRVIYEFKPAPDGRQTRVAALDEDTLAEVVVVCPADAPRSRMEQVAYNKLKRVQNPRDDRSGGGRGSLGPGTGGGVTV